MKSVNIMVYKSELVNGDISYAALISEWDFFGRSESLKTIALVVLSEIVMLKDKDDCEFSIDCSPLHYIVMKPGFVLHRCLPLTPEEQDEFWKYFAQIKE